VKALRASRATVCALWRQWTVAPWEELGNNRTPNSSAKPTMQPCPGLTHWPPSSTKVPSLKWTADRAATDPALRFQHKHTDASGGQPTRCIQRPDSPGPDYHDVAELPHCRMSMRASAEGRDCYRPDPSGQPCGHPTIDPAVLRRIPRQLLLSARRWHLHRRPQS
jgi:hypothetical protein